MEALQPILCDIIDAKKIFYLVALIVRLELIWPVLTLCRFNGEIQINQNVDFTMVRKGLYDSMEDTIKNLPKENQAVILSELVNKYNLLDDIVKIIDVKSKEKELIKSFYQSVVAKIVNNLTVQKNAQVTITTTNGHGVKTTETYELDHLGNKHPVPAVRTVDPRVTITKSYFETFWTATEAANALSSELKFFPDRMFGVEIEGENIVIVVDYPSLKTYAKGFNEPRPDSEICSRLLMMFSFI
jgi:hypothetical protein